MKTLRDFFKGSGKKENNEKLTKAENSQLVEQATKYQCPMKCEGYKLYDAPGNCPVCNMKLVPVSPGKAEHNHQSHQHHGHGNHDHKHHGCCQ